jgi:hypothetical protein
MAALDIEAPGIEAPAVCSDQPVLARTELFSVGGQPGAGLDGASDGEAVNQADSSSRKIGSSCVMSSP